MLPARKLSRSSNTTNSCHGPPAPHPPPGERLQKEFLQPLGVSHYRLAKAIGLPASRISEIVTGQWSITADTDLRVCLFLGLSPGYWLRAQAAHDTEVASAELADDLEQIQPLVAAQT